MNSTSCDKIFESIAHNVQLGKIRVGVRRDHANTFWCSTTLIGKVLNYGTPVLTVLTIIFFFKSLYTGFLAFLCTLVYAYTLSKYASLYTKQKLLSNMHLFFAAYDARSITLKCVATGEIVYYPADPSNIL